MSLYKTKIGLAHLAGLSLLAVFAASPPAAADQVVITYSPAGEYSANFGQICANTVSCDYGTENFSSWTGGNFTSTFQTGPSQLSSGVSFSGTYTAGADTTSSQWTPMAQNQYGGYGGGNFPELYGPLGVPNPDDPSQTASTYDLSLSATGVPGVNYFGVWISALDAFNDMLVYNTSGQLIAQFSSATLLAALGSCTSGDNAYCGNPTAAYLGQDPNELFAFVNIYDQTGDIGKVVFSDDNGTGFESTNDTVAFLNPVDPYGNPINAPEPASFALLGCGIVGLLATARRRHTA